MDNVLQNIPVLPVFVDDALLLVKTNEKHINHLEIITRVYRSWKHPRSKQNGNRKIIN